MKYSVIRYYSSILTWGKKVLIIIRWWFTAATLQQDGPMRWCAMTAVTDQRYKIQQPIDFVPLCKFAVVLSTFILLSTERRFSKFPESFAYIWIDELLWLITIKKKKTKTYIYQSTERVFLKLSVFEPSIEVSALRSNTRQRNYSESLLASADVNILVYM